MPDKDKHYIVSLTCGILKKKKEEEGVPGGWYWRAFLPAPAAAKSLQSCPTLCDPRDGSPPGSSVPGILQARSLEWVAISFSNAWKWKVKVKSLSRVWLFSYPMDCSRSGSSVHGIFQARVLEWGAIAFSTSLPGISSNLIVIITQNSIKFINCKHMTLDL